MTQFEFVQVTIAIILGLGLTDILRNLGEQFRNRSEIEVSWLQVGASCMLLLVILIYNLWGFWGALGVNWTLQLFLLQVAPAIALALSAQLIKVDLSSGKTGGSVFRQLHGYVHLVGNGATARYIFFVSNRQFFVSNRQCEYCRRSPD